MTTQDPMIHIREVLEEAREALQLFARCPPFGKSGVERFVIANATYDGTRRSATPREAYWHWDDFVAVKNAVEKIDEALAALDQPSLKELRTVGEDASEPPLLSERFQSAGADHAPGSAARDGSEAPSLKDDGEPVAIFYEIEERLTKLSRRIIREYGLGVMDDTILEIKGIIDILRFKTPEAMGLKDDDVERVARGLHAEMLAMEAEEGDGGCSWEELSEHQLAMINRLSKAAIEAMSVSSCGSAHD